MNEPEQKPASLPETTPPHVPLHRNRAPLSFRVNGIRLIQSEDRLVVVNYIKRRIFVCFKCICLLPFPLLTHLPSLFYWNNFFRYASWQTFSSAVLVTNWQLDPGVLMMYSLMVMLYWALATGDNLHGFVLDRRRGTIKAAGRTRPLTDLEAVEVVTTRVRGRSYHCWIVLLVWSVERKSSWWQLRETNQNLKMSTLGVSIYPKDIPDVEKLAEIVAEFAGVPVRHQNWIK